jgi:hypothetical protein
MVQINIKISKELSHIERIVHIGFFWISLCVLIDSIVLKINYYSFSETVYQSKIIQEKWTVFKVELIERSINIFLIKDTKNEYVIQNNVSKKFVDWQEKKRIISGMWQRMQLIFLQIS